MVLSLVDAKHPAEFEIVNSSPKLWPVVFGPWSNGEEEYLL